MKTKIKQISIFMILLVLTMPFAFADSIRVIDVKGKDGVQNFIREDDIVKIITSISSEKINNTDVKLTTGLQAKPFNGKCTEKNGIFNCTHEEQVNIRAKRYSLTVKTQSSTKTIPFYVDNIAPTITVTKPPQQVGPNITFEYKVKDFSCKTGCLNKCSGLKSVKIGNNVITSFDGCQYEGKHSSALTKSGIQNIRIEATDNFNQKTTLATSDFDADITPPELMRDSLKFMKGNAEFTYVSGRGNTFEIRVKVTDKTGVDQVTADFSEFNPSSDPIPFSKIEEDEYVWENVAVRISEGNSKNVKIKFHVTDKLGNAREYTVNQLLKVDRDDPKVLMVGTEGCDDNFCYVKNGVNKFITKIEETGSGFNYFSKLNNVLGKNIVFDLTSLGLSKARAKNCTQVGNIWTCFGQAEVRGLSDNSLHKIYITDDSFDDTGNQVTGTQEGKIKVDNTNPEIISVEYFAIGENGKSNYFVQGDLVSIEARIKDTSPVRAIADLTKLTGSLIPVTDCVKENNDYLCKWDTIGTLLTPHPKDNILTSELIFLDGASNEVRHEENTAILFRENDQHDVWNVNTGAITVLPSRLDKNTKAKISYDIFAEVPLFGADAKVLSADVISCTDKGGHIKEEAKISTTPGKSLLMQFKLNKKAFKKDDTSLSFNCEISTVSQIGNFVTRPEYDNFTVKVPLYDMPLGSLTDNTERLIEDAKDGLFKLAGKLKFLEKFLAFTEKACKIQQMLSGIGTIVSLFDLLKQKTPFFIALGKASPSKGPKMFSFVETISGYLNKFCEFSSCNEGSTHLSNKLNLFGNFNYDTIAGIEYGKESPKETEKIRNNAKNSFLGFNVKNNLEGRGFTDVGIWPRNPQDSLVLSMIAMCPAGIVKNLAKYRQIKCTYIDCLKNKVPQGIPVTACTMQHEYMQCKYVYGEIFQLIPFVHIWKRFGQQIKSILNDPVSLFYGVGGLGCNPNNPSIGGSQCQIIHYTKKIGRLLNQLQGFNSLKDGFSLDIPSQGDACKGIE